MQRHQTEHIHPEQLLADLPARRCGVQGGQLLALDPFLEGQNLPPLHVVQISQLLLHLTIKEGLPAQVNAVTVSIHIPGIPVVCLQCDGNGPKLLFRHGFGPCGDAIERLNI